MQLSSDHLESGHCISQVAWIDNAKASLQHTTVEDIETFPPTMFVHTHNVLFSISASWISIGCYLPSRLLSDVSGPSFVLTYVFHAKLCAVLYYYIYIDYRCRRVRTYVHMSHRNVLSSLCQQCNVFVAIISLFLPMHLPNTQLAYSCCSSQYT